METRTKKLVMLGTSLGVALTIMIITLATFMDHALKAY